MATCAWWIWPRGSYGIRRARAIFGAVRFLANGRTLIAADRGERRSVVL